MVQTDNIRSAHMKLQEFINCFLGTDHKKELENFSTPRLTGPTREEVADEALRFFAITLLYGIDEKVGDISFVRRTPDGGVCRMSGEKFYEFPLPKEEIVTCLFEEIEEMTGMDSTKHTGQIILGLQNDEFALRVSSGATDAGEQKMLIQLPQLA